MNRVLTSLQMVEEKASAKPAVDALIAGFTIAANPVTPTTALDNRLKRDESHRFTIRYCQRYVAGGTIVNLPPHIQ